MSIPPRKPWPPLEPHEMNNNPSSFDKSLRHKIEDLALAAGIPLTLRSRAERFIQQCAPHHRAREWYQIIESMLAASAPSSIAATGEAPRILSRFDIKDNGELIERKNGEWCSADDVSELERELAVCYEHIQRDDKEILSLHARLAAQRPPIAAPSDAIIELCARKGWSASMNGMPPAPVIRQLKTVRGAYENLTAAELQAAISVPSHVATTTELQDALLRRAATIAEKPNLYTPTALRQTIAEMASAFAVSAMAAPNFDGRDFYELCQQYRHARHDPVVEFAAIIQYAQTGALPWPSYEDDAATDDTADKEPT